MSQLIIHTDGGARSNPGPAGVGVVAQMDGVEVFALGKSIGVATNNEAEYQAFLTSLDWLLQYLVNPPQEIEKIIWKLDSKLVVEQLNKHWKIKEERLRSLAHQAWQQIDKLTIPHFLTHVPREENARADELYNSALDEAGF